MSTLGVVLLIVVGAVAFTAVLLVVIAALQRATLAALRGPLMARVRARYPDERQLLHVDYAANSFGLASLGKLQARGNGAVAVTAEELRFLQFLPEREFAIPLRAIQTISFTKRHLGKATPFRLVKVEFAGAAGPDAIAIMVPDPDALRAQLEAARTRAADRSA